MVQIRNTIQNITHNNFKTYDYCKKKYYYEYILELHWPDKPVKFEFGLSVHKLLDYQSHNLDVNMLISSASEEIKDIWEILMSSEILTYEVIESEWPFNVLINTNCYWLEGRIDRLVYDKKRDKYIIVDFKTGQELPSLKKEDWQAIVYLYCISEAKKISPDRLEFMYYKPDIEAKSRIIEYSQEIHRIYEQKIIEKISQIKQTSNWQPNFDCNYECQYKALCSADRIPEPEYSPEFEDDTISI